MIPISLDLSGIERANMLERTAGGTAIETLEKREWGNRPPQADRADGNRKSAVPAAHLLSDRRRRAMV